METSLSSLSGSSSLWSLQMSSNSFISFRKSNSLNILRPLLIWLSRFLSLFTDGILLSRAYFPYTVLLFMQVTYKLAVYWRSWQNLSRPLLLLSRLLKLLVFLDHIEIRYKVLRRILFSLLYIDY